MAEQKQVETGVQKWVLEPTHTQVEFSTKHMMFTTVRGLFSEASGTILVDRENPDNSSVEVEIDAASIDTRVEDRDAHLRSEDFLDVENHPKITFRSKRVSGAHAEPGDEFDVVGDLTIRGETREVALKARFEGEAKDPWGVDRVGFSATGKVDRREFGLTWNQALEAGGVLVGNEVTITVNASAVPADS